MAKNRILKSAEPMFHWNVAPGVPFETMFCTAAGPGRPVRRGRM